MKKYLFLFVCVVIGFALLAGCSMPAKGTDATLNEIANQSGDTTDWEPTSYETVNNLEGVTMVVKKGIASPCELTVEFENNSNSQCIYGSYFLLEKIIGGRWYQVPVTIEGNYGFDSIGYNLASGGTGEWPINWEWLYGRLGPGEYRIVKDILILSDIGNYDTYYLAAEFAV